MNLLATYFHELHMIRGSGSAVKETSYYPALINLLNAVGKTLKPRVRCILNPANRGAGIPDGGLFSAEQFPRNAEGPALNTLPGRGVIEVKGSGEDVSSVAQTPQVAKYLEKYRQVVVTNYRDFVLVTRSPDGTPAPLERYRLAENEADFWQTAANAFAVTEEQSERFADYLCRAMLHAAPVAGPRETAWFLASYAREAKARLERPADDGLPALNAVRSALEQALGMKFEGSRGEHFFRATLIQTLFYGIFSAWVLWSKRHSRTDTAAHFDWRTANWELHVPLIRALFEQVAMPSKLKPLDLEEVLDWTGSVLNRVDRASFFEKFEETHAVQYFYEPFLEAYDPELRKELGVWYTPPEYVEYMVERVDAALREELGIEDGLADPRVHVLDPCCGTGTYVVAVLRRIAKTLREKGEDALVATAVKRAAKERVFGFEILPAPFVVAHLQLGLLLQNLGAPLSAKTDERVGVFLTNALTGWEPPKGPKQHLVFPELEAERDAAERVKQRAPILVILGNPPYNGFAGLAVAEERDLSNAYRTTKQAAAPQGQGLNDLYIRFFRMAERRIVEQTGRGIVCFISNYSWLDGLSFTGMRERFLEVFDSIRVDCLNGDKYKTGKLTPEGQPDPSVFSTEWNREGIQVGTAITLLVRKEAHHGAEGVEFRNLWGRTKGADLLESLGQDRESLYTRFVPTLRLGLPFTPLVAEASYLDWPLLPDLFPITIPGVNTSRDLDIVSVDREPLERRVATFFDVTLTDEAVRRVAPSLMAASGGYDPQVTRQHLLRCGMASGYFVRYEYRPFDTRFVYWHAETKLIDRKREDLFAGSQAGNLFLTSRQKSERQNEGTPFYVTRHLPDRHLTRPGSACFPMTLSGFRTGRDNLFTEEDVDAATSRANLSEDARRYLTSLGLSEPDSDPVTAGMLWMHALAIGYSPAYLSENAGALWQDWPRIPLPDSRKTLEASAALGREIAALLDLETAVPGVTTGPIGPELRVIGIVSRVGGGALDPDAGDLAITVGWGHAGAGGVTMPAKGRVVERDYTPEEQVALGDAGTVLGDRTVDVYLNENGYWRNVPSRVWGYTIGGYQVIKKWLSYREKPLLGRALTEDEARMVSQIARRIAALILLQPALEANYAAVKGAVRALATDFDSGLPALGRTGPDAAAIRDI